MNKLKIAMLQVSPCGSLDKNLTNAKHVSFASFMPIYAKVHICDFGAERALTLAEKGVSFIPH